MNCCVSHPEQEERGPPPWFDKAVVACRGESVVLLVLAGAQQAELEQATNTVMETLPLLSRWEVNGKTLLQRKSCKCRGEIHSFHRYPTQGFLEA